MSSDAEKLVEEYISTINGKLQTGLAREHAYRPAFEGLVSKLNDEIKVLNEPSRSEHGNPDLVFLRKSLTVGYAETKDIGVDLNKVEKTQQMERYLGYSNLILTDYLGFRFFKNGERYGEEIVVAIVQNNTLIPKQENFGILTDTLSDFLKGEPEPIKNGKRLARIMGGKARRIRDNVNHYLNNPSQKNKELERVYEIIKKLLVHDLSVGKFADMYAQTLVYGLFVARFHDTTPKDFTRSEARDLIPASNPFLRHFFDHIAGASFDKRLGYIVDELCSVFSCSDVHALMAQYFEKDGITEKPDPVIHFYEDFLKEYDSEQRKSLGAFYTPLPIVRFIIKSVDSILEKEFGLTEGLADTSKIEIKRVEQRQKIKEQVHRVQVLDPAVGTGTFLNEVIKSIYSRFKGQAGRWKAYVDEDLLPRIYGFELMMAPYTIAHLKLGITLNETGYDHFEKRLGVYLTNSLEEAHDQPNLFSLIGLSESLADEARQASKIKGERPIMVIMGNPPYSGVSSNETIYANLLVEKYKVEPGGRQKLQERKHWLNDDYVKFIAFAEAMIEKNQDGVVSFVTNNGYLDNPTFRGMRWHLAKTFDKIYVLDLHGNSKKKEKAPDGSKDENVFRIQQGVAILIAIKTTSKKKKSLATIYHAEIFGNRSRKFELLEREPSWAEIPLDQKMLYFVPKNTNGLEEYNKGIKINELFKQNVTGIVTMGDKFIINENKNTISQRIQKLSNGEYAEEELDRDFGLGKNYAKWAISNQRAVQFNESKIIKIAYRPFDNRWTYFDNKVIWRWREKIMRHYLLGDNIGLLVTKNLKDHNYSHIFATRNISEAIFLSSVTASNAMNIPLYLYDSNGLRIPNLDKNIINKINGIVGSTTPESIFDYIYAVLHSPNYREKYNEFLKVDFPRVPYPKNTEQFNRLVSLGRELRLLHLLESPKVNQFITNYDIPGSHRVEKVEYRDRKVYINKDQYFGNVPEVAWSFWIGGYQPAQKWLKDRKGRSLANDDIVHYQKMIVVLLETERIMKEIDKIMIHV